MLSPAPRVLVVDDEDVICQLLADALSLRGFEVETAGTVADGLARALVQRPDVVLLDMTLRGESPGIDAVPAFARIASVVIMSGAIDVDLLQLARDRGAVDWVTKPFDLERVGAIAAAAAARRRDAPGA